jgi:hypothetical protein
MIRADKIGSIDHLVEASSRRGAGIKLICPLSNENSGIVRRISEKASSIRILNGGSSRSGLFAIDSAKLLRFEPKDPKAEDFSEAIG